MLRNAYRHVVATTCTIEGGGARDDGVADASATACPDYLSGWCVSPSDGLTVRGMATEDGLHHCAHCQRRTVEIDRGQNGCAVTCHSCRRKWLYPNSALSDEIALESYVWHATVSPEQTG